MLQKELREILGERQSRRGGFVQAIILTLVMGVVYPLSVVKFWLGAHPLAIVYFAFFPGMLAVTVAADAFAGERERKTLETLLAAPLGEWAILAGKVGAAVVWSLSVTTVAFVCAVVTVNLATHGPGVFLPAPVLVAGAFSGALASSSLLTAVAVIMSMRVAVARSAQQMTALLSLVLFGGIATAWGALGVPLEWANVFAAEALLAALAALALMAARIAFRRDRFFDSR
jgi:ABC-2 type transport system permease protein